MAVDLEFLRRVALFVGLTDDELRALARGLVERRYDPGEIVLTEEETGRCVYVVREGRVKVSRWLPSGRELILAYHDPPEHFGEMALLDGRTTPATVTAVSASAVVLLGRAQFDSLLRTPNFARALLQVLCGRCRDAWSQLEILNQREPETRLRMALHRLCASHGRSGPEGTWIDLRLTHRELANIVGVTRETATRALSRLEAEKLVIARDRSFLVPDPDRLLEDLD
jgi:CRP/FNR family transcriptional regulator, cyclic AMP receptor protein